MAATAEMRRRVMAHERTRREEEWVVFTRLERERSPAARDAIVERFMPLARMLARRYRNIDDIDDLEQVAAIGLVKAIERFDPKRGRAFSTFAFPTILGELKRHLRDRSWSVRVPRDIQDRCARLDRVSEELFLSLGRAPTVAELAVRAESSVEQVLEALQAATARRALSLDQPARDTDAGGLEIAVEDAGFATAEDASVLDGLLRDLPQRERRLLWLRFREDLTQAEIGERVGISQMQVSRLTRAALERLQADAARQSA